MMFEVHSSNNDGAIINTYKSLGDAAMRIREHNAVGNSACFIKNIDEVTTATDHQEGGEHYKAMNIQPIQYIMANSLDFCEGNVVKYVSRYKNKNGVEDLKKAMHYLQLLIEDIEDES